MFVINQGRERSFKESQRAGRPPGIFLEPGWSLRVESSDPACERVEGKRPCIWRRLCLQEHCQSLSHIPPSQGHGHERRRVGTGHWGDGLDFVDLLNMSLMLFF